MEITIKNPVFNSAHELTAFDGLVLDSKGKMLETPENLKLVNIFKELPRLSPYTGSSAPRVIIEGKEYALSYKFYTAEEKQTYKDYRNNHSGTGGNSGPRAPSVSAKKLDTIARVVLADKEMMKKLDADSIEFLKTCVLEDPKIIAAVKSLMALGFTEEQARAAIAPKK